MQFVFNANFSSVGVLFDRKVSFVFAQDDSTSKIRIKNGSRYIFCSVLLHKKYSNRRYWYWFLVHFIGFGENYCEKREFFPLPDPLQRIASCFAMTGRREYTKEWSKIFDGEILKNKTILCTYTKRKYKTAY